MDEPTSTAAEHNADGLARTLHKASARLGFRAKFLLTDDPRPTSLGPLLPANKYLWNDVDIWCTALLLLLRPRAGAAQAAGQGRPGVVVSLLQLVGRGAAQLRDRQAVGRRAGMGLADVPVERRWHALLGRQPLGQRAHREGTRDPYQNPLSFEYSDGRVANGEACLIYPGYYPRYGLDDKNAPPVSSLRLEALRDGFQDLEYLKLATKLCGAAYVKSVVKSITTYPYPIAYGHTLQVPEVRHLAGRLRRRPREARPGHRAGPGLVADHGRRPPGGAVSPLRSPRGPRGAPRARRRRAPVRGPLRAAPRRRVRLRARRRAGGL